MLVVGWVRVHVVNADADESSATGADLPFDDLAVIENHA